MKKIRTFKFRLKIVYKKEWDTAGGSSSRNTGNGLILREPMKWVNDAVDVASGLGYVELMSAVRRLRFLYQIVFRGVLKCC